MNDHLRDGHQIQTFAVAVFLALFLSSCIQEAEWTWTGDTPQTDVSLDQITVDGTGDIGLSDIPIADTDVIESDAADILPGPVVLVVAVPAVFSGESIGGGWTLRPMVQGGAHVMTNAE